MESHWPVRDQLHDKYPLSARQLELLRKKDDMITVLSRANLFANDKDLD